MGGGEEVARDAPPLYMQDVQYKNIFTMRERIEHIHIVYNYMTYIYNVYMHVCLVCYYKLCTDFKQQ